MGCMLRSDPMTLCGMYLQPEVAFEVLSQLGELGCVQFIDMYPDLQLFQRNYVLEVCRYSEMERRLQVIANEMRLNNIPMIEEQNVECSAQPLNEMVQFENMLERWEQDIQDMTANEVSLLKSYFELTEFHYVLTYIGPLLGDSEIRKETLLSSRKRDQQQQQAAAGDVVGGRLIVITGVVRRTKCFAFEMMLWRVSHGIVYYKQASDDKILIDPQTRQEIRKVAFLAICQGEALAVRVEKICTGFQVNTFPCPNTQQERQDLMEKLQIRISDLDEVLHKTKYLRCKTLRTVSRSFRLWLGQVKKSKAIYHTMNMMRKEKCLIGECWIPTCDVERVNDILTKCSDDLQSNVPSFTSKIETKQMPPTFHRTNKFTRGFQNLINAYGDSTYRELNPGLYTLVTFPFLFAIMFGDLGHGIILAGFGVWMWRNEKTFDKANSTNEIWNIFYGGRYVVLLMGLFSIFTGFCYNDIFSKAFLLSNSYWVNLKNVDELSREEYIDLDPSLETREPYIYGKDPIWALAKNKIMFENSFKMKSSIIIGIIHMMFGIVLSFFNYRYFKRTYSIVLQFFPELMFLTLLFFWLVVMIYMKWFLYGPKEPDQEKNTACAPQILLLFIDMVLMSETKPANEGCKEGYIFPSQRTFQMSLVFAALLCVPILLLGTPIYKIVTNKKKKVVAMAALLAYQRDSHPDPKILAGLEAEVEHFSESVGELMIHQGVHTIEFVLSTISHTASYLRLWALSLAHAQLSEMLWNMVLAKMALHERELIGAINIVIVFALWAAFTLSILVVMEGLSAFLHCLRLHWVEFMSKFYSGGGWPFRPYSFEVILLSEADKTEAGCKKATGMFQQQ
ncbi:V-type proton ATPase 116 kDa subunit a-like [Spodoptera litura]|uniref:V-type proton ATPase subunit a n=1 Tax=Spodoptera litura TaxID=69820 RepID=A0A9J7ER24_SPOLT|nr:V-type proton ATPase 116 kDa subunit a-like [Spodoptera litura]